MGLGSTELRMYCSVCLSVLGLVGFVVLGVGLVSMVYRTTLDKMKFRLVFCLFISNLLQEIGFAMCLAWKDSPPVEGDLICMIQGFVLHFGDLSSGFWNVAIAVYLLALTKITNRDYIPGRKFGICCQLIWVFCLILGCWGLFFHDPKKYFVPISGGAWCWISPSYPMEKLITFYIWIDGFAILLLLIYSVIIASYYFKKHSSSETKGLVSSLLGFPLVFCVCYVPLSLVRLIDVIRGSDLPIIWVYVCVGLWPLEGTFNTILYGKTRKIFSCPAVTSNRSSRALSTAGHDLT